MHPERIKALRTTLNLTQEEMATALAMKHRAIVYWEAGTPRRSPTGPALILLHMLERHPKRLREVRDLAAEIAREKAGGDDE